MKTSKFVLLSAAIALGTATAFAGPAEDAMLTARVKTALVASTSAKAIHVDVESKDGVVQLKGYVDSTDRISAVAKVAADVEGVSKVENNLKVQPAERSTGAVIDDAVITAKIKSSLLADSGTHGLKIDVDTRKGAVQLNGFVSSATEKSLAHDLAAKVDGVKSVENNLTVRP